MRGARSGALGREGNRPWNEHRRSRGNFIGTDPTIRKGYQQSLLAWLEVSRGQSTSVCCTQKAVFFNLKTQPLPPSWQRALDAGKLVKVPVDKGFAHDFFAGRLR
ncbi:hypothetical protein HRbin30_00063 [bacterium HR30]|nr:hypothetical protein HRbin30_00063 [bacterium HR30]